MRLTFPLTQGYVSRTSVFDGFLRVGSLNSYQISTPIADYEKIKATHDKLDLNCVQLYAKSWKRKTEDLFVLMKVVGWVSPMEVLVSGFVNEITDLEDESTPCLIDALTSVKVSFVMIVTKINLPIRCELVI